MTDAWLFHTNWKHSFENKNCLAFSTYAPGWSSSCIFEFDYTCASTFLWEQVGASSSPFPSLRLAQLEHGATNTKGVGSIPTRAIYLRAGLEDPCGTFQSKNILSWSFCQPHTRACWQTKRIWCTIKCICDQLWGPQHKKDIDWLEEGHQED